MGRLTPKTCNEKIARRSAKATCDIIDGKHSQAGCSFTNLSKHANPAPPTHSADMKTARRGFMRHHWIKRRSARAPYCWKKPGVCRERLPAMSCWLCKFTKLPVASRPDWTLSRTGARNATILASTGPASWLGSSPQLWEWSTLPRETKNSRNCALLTLVSPAPAISSNKVLITSGVGFALLQVLKKPCNSCASITPFRLRSTVSHSFSSALSSIDLCSCGVSTRAGFASRNSLLETFSFFSIHVSKSISGLKSVICGFSTSPLSTSMNQSAGLSFCGREKPRLSKYGLAPKEGPRYTVLPPLPRSSASSKSVNSE
mmetsp:Transcript_67863/g.190071  ORF Transcript_67863/g.190071 Transcript_67863/m.190071 type:complete len:316 (-) Transcript_67863:930-1877(-)